MAKLLKARAIKLISLSVCVILAAIANAQQLIDESQMNGVPDDLILSDASLDLSVTESLEWQINDQQTQSIL